MAREPFNRIWTETPTVDDFDEPTNTMWEEGWRGGADQDPPEAFAQNWWQNRADFALQQIERQGYMDYEPDAIYQRGGRARGSDGEFYISIAGPNTGNDPVTDGGINWIADPVNDFTLLSTGHERLQGGLLLQWVRATGLAGPAASEGSTISHTLDFETSFSAVFGVLPVSFNDPGEPNPEGVEMSAAVESQGVSSTTIRFTRLVGNNTGGETIGCFIFALGI